MEKMIIQPSGSSPLIDFNPCTGIFKIEGRSILEDPSLFYDNIMNWLGNYFTAPHNLTHFNFKLEYINSSSSKYLSNIFKFIEDYHCKGANIEINWYFEKSDESIEEIGEHYKSRLKLKFNLIPYKG